MYIKYSIFIRETHFCVAVLKPDPVCICRLLLFLSCSTSSLSGGQFVIDTMVNMQLVWHDLFVLWQQSMAVFWRGFIHPRDLPRYDPFQEEQPDWRLTVFRCGWHWARCTCRTRWEKEEGQWRSYPLNDSIELDRYWQVFSTAGNEASQIRRNESRQVLRRSIIAANHSQLWWQLWFAAMMNNGCHAFCIHEIPMHPQLFFCQGGITKAKLKLLKNDVVVDFNQMTAQVGRLIWNIWAFYFRVKKMGVLTELSGRGRPPAQDRKAVEDSWLAEQPLLLWCVPGSTKPWLTYAESHVHLWISW